MIREIGILLKITVHKTYFHPNYNKLSIDQRYLSNNNNNNNNNTLVFLYIIFEKKRQQYDVTSWTTWPWLT
jgi:hypothetical protein